MYQVSEIQQHSNQPGEEERQVRSDAQTFSIIPVERQENGVFQSAAELKEQLKIYKEEINQKNDIIKQLQQRCMVVVSYEQKILQLETRAQKLERILEDLEEAQKKSSPQPGNKQRVIENDYQMKDICCCCQKTKKRKSGNKKNIPRLNLNQLSLQRGGEDKRKKDSQIKGSTHNYEQYTNSSFSNQRQSYQNKEKCDQINNKFNKIKENLETCQGKPKSTKKIQEIYSLINHFKSRKEELAIKGINQKLENILNQSYRCNKSEIKSPKGDTASFSFNFRSDSKDGFSKYINTERPKSQSVSLNSSFTGINPKLDYTMQSENEHKNRGRGTFKRQNQVIFTKFQDSKFKKILNAKNVDDILKARKCTSFISTKQNESTKYSHYLLPKDRNTMYWK